LKQTNCACPAGSDSIGNFSKSDDLDMTMDPVLAQIFERHQSRDSNQPLEDAWQRTTWRRILSGYNFDLGVAAMIYLAAVVAAICVIVIAGLPATSQLPAG
jgi:hypothetical protein